MVTLLAGFVFNFSNIFCDWVFEAMAAMIANLRQTVECDLCAFASRRDDVRWVKSLRPGQTLGSAGQISIESERGAPQAKPICL